MAFMYSSNLSLESSLYFLSKINDMTVAAFLLRRFTYKTRRRTGRLFGFVVPTAGQRSHYYCNRGSSAAGIYTAGGGFCTATSTSPRRLVLSGGGPSRRVHARTHLRLERENYRTHTHTHTRVRARIIIRTIYTTLLNSRAVLGVKLEPIDGWNYAARVTTIITYERPRVHE